MQGYANEEIENNGYPYPDQPNGYPQDEQEGTGESQEGGYPVQNLDAGFAAVEGQGSVMEAICLRRALFITPDGYQGVFVVLPTAPDQPVPFLFVQAKERAWVGLGEGQS